MVWYMRMKKMMALVKMMSYFLRRLKALYCCQPV